MWRARHWGILPRRHEEPRLSVSLRLSDVAAPARFGHIAQVRVRLMETQPIGWTGSETAPGWEGTWDARRWAPMIAPPREWTPQLPDHVVFEVADGAGGHEVFEVSDGAGGHEDLMVFDAWATGMLLADGSTFVVSDGGRFIPDE